MFSPPTNPYDALKRNARLDWLKANSPDNTCRILSNARCLSEGVDVPALDAVLFSYRKGSQSGLTSAATTQYIPFNGIVLTDTFQMAETKGEMEEKMFPKRGRSDN